MAGIPDRVGLGWRGELAAGIFAHLDHVDLLELIADDHFHASRQALRPLKTLCAQVPVTLHGVSLGLAGSEAADRGRIDAMARLVGELAPESWSEHLAFVRAGGIEIGHLAAPPRSARNVEAAAANIVHAARVVGAPPLMENIASLVAPPGCALDEADWTARILADSGAGLLLDLHNLYANARNFGEQPTDLLRRFPLARVRAVHLSGGHWIAEPEGPGMRLLDDHVHDVPTDVFDLLARLASLAPQPLTVVIERDGRYPAFETLLAQMDAARAALARGRASAAADAGDVTAMAA